MCVFWCLAQYWESIILSVNIYWIEEYENKHGDWRVCKAVLPSRKMASKMCMNYAKLLSGLPEVKKQQPRVYHKFQDTPSKSRKVHWLRTTEWCWPLDLTYHCLSPHTSKYLPMLWEFKSAPKWLSVSRLQPLLKEKNFNPNPPSSHDLITVHWLNKWQ